MKEFKAKLNDDGRVLIPVSIRKLLDFKPGEDLIIRLSDNALNLISAKQLLRQAQQKVKELTKGTSLVEQLKILRKEDNDRQ